MTKYVLAKDLPFAKAGAEVIQDSMVAYIRTEKIYSDFHKKYGGSGSWKNYLGLIPDLLAEGWIEEVKPRQWYVPENILRTYGSEVKPMLNLPYGEGVLKVVEALE